MAAYTMSHMNTYGPTRKKHKWTSDGGGAKIMMESVRIDFDAFATANSVALAVSDTYQVFDIKAGETVLVCGFNVVTAATGASDMDLGLTGGDVDGFIDGIEANDASPTVVAAPFGLLSGTTFSSADTLDILEVTGAQTLAACVCDFWVIKLVIGL
jgi:hypothetical protein